MRSATSRDERGQSISLFVLVIMGALIITTGLVIDGGQKVAATAGPSPPLPAPVVPPAMRLPPNSWAARIQPVPQCWQRRPTLPASPRCRGSFPSPMGLC